MARASARGEACEISQQSRAIQFALRPPTATAVPKGGPLVSFRIVGPFSAATAPRVKGSKRKQRSARSSGLPQCQATFDARALQSVPHRNPSCPSVTSRAQGISAPDFLVEAGVVKSKREARELRGSLLCFELAVARVAPLRIQVPDVVEDDRELCFEILFTGVAPTRDSSEVVAHA